MKAVLKESLKNSEIPSSFLKLSFFFPCFSGVQGGEAPLRRTYFGKNQNFLKMFFRLLFIGGFISIFLYPFKAISSNTKEVQKNTVPEWIYPAPFKYDIKNLPDPFIPFIKREALKKISPKKTNRPLTPLEKIDPSQLKLVGIVYSKTLSPMALVELPNKKGYVLRQGTKIGVNGAYVKNIYSTHVVIVEPFMDIFGKKQYKNIVLKLHKRKGE